MTQQEKDDLLTEAKRRYPIGTKFISEFDDGGVIREIYPFDLNKSVSFKFQGDNIRIENGISVSRTYGCSNPLIYKNGKWAEIVSKPEEKKKYAISELKYPIAIHITSKEQHDKLNMLDIPEYGDEYPYYLINRGRSKTKYEGPAVGGGGNYINIEFEDIIFPEEPINTYGLKVGDTLRADILNKWVKIPGNQFKSLRGEISTNGSYLKDRKIEGFELINNQTVFKISGTTSNIWYAKAEGFKEFMDNFDKPKTMKQELTSLPEKYQVVCSNKEETSIVMTSLYSPRGDWGHWQYVTFDTTKPSNKVGNPNIFSEKRDGFTEITFDQFKKWVLKSEDKPVEERYRYEVIHCTTQKEWDFAKEKLKNPEYSNTWNIYKGDSCLVINHGSDTGTHSNLNYFKSNHSKIYSFSEWCTKFNHKPEKDLELVVDKPYSKEPKSLVGRYLKCIKENDFGSKIGSYLRITDAGNIKENQIEGHVGKCIYVSGQPFALERVWQNKQFELMPEGFEPDQKEQFIPGKWYKSNIDKSSNKLNFYYIKYSHSKGDSIWGNTVESDGRYNKDTYWDYNKAIEQAIKFGPVEDLSEIQQYLPEGHPDKVIYQRGYDIYGNPTTKSAYDAQFKKSIDLSNTKIWIGDNPELSKKVQEKAFELGWKWNSGEKKINHVNTSSLFFYDDKTICFSTDNTEKFQINNKKKKEIFPSDLGITSNVCAEVDLKLENPKIEYLDLEFNDKTFYELETKPKIDAEVFNLKIQRKSGSVTLKSMENEVKINVKTKKSIKLN